jgi:hypothetical protein
MKWFKLSLMVAFVVALALSAGTAEASRIYLSSSSTNPQLNVNPTITLTPSSTAALYLFWQPTTEQVGTDPYGYPIVQNEQLSGWGHDIVASNPLVDRVSYTIANPTVFGSARWGSANTGGGAVTFVVDNANAVRVGGSNLGFGTTGQDATYHAGTGTWRMATLVLHCLGVGTTEIRLGVGQAGISFQTNPNARPINFGFGDAAVDSNNFGATSELADATIIQIPEPSTLVLFGLGAVGLVAIARRRRK